jgi:Icc-related predicted phosphoesterase
LNCIFVSDIHGLSERYFKLFKLIEAEKPDAVFMGGDILPSGMFMNYETHDIDGDFIDDFLLVKFAALKALLEDAYPRVFIILGNDDGRNREMDFINGTEAGIWEYIHLKKAELGKYKIYGYSYVPPTPFQLKDWERYDISRYVDPGCISPEEGKYTVAVTEREKRYSTIKDDLDKYAEEDNLDNAIMLFHTPPYQTKLDRANLDGKMFDHVPLDVHVGSIALRRFIEARQPLLTLHGHIHESAKMTGSWRDRIDRTHMFSAAHNGRELAVVRFDPENLKNAVREII